MHLAKVYARDLGVDISTPVFQPHFVPITDEKYIVFHNGIKVPAKTYSYWADVIRLVKPVLDREGITTVQIGLPDEPQIQGIDRKIVTSNLKQASFIIQNSVMMVGIDSVPIHLASALDVPSVSIYGHTYASTCSPLWNKKSKAIVIESHRNGNKPSFSLEENPKTIDMIMPEEIAGGILEQLGVKDYLLPKTIHVGNHYNTECLDFVPPREEIEVVPRLPNSTNYRMDLSHNEDVLKQALELQNGQCNIKTKLPIDPSILRKYKAKIQTVLYQHDSFNKNFVESMKKIGLNFALVCCSPETLQEQRLKFLDYEVHYFNEQEFKEMYRKKIQEKCSFDSIMFNTRKVYIYGTEQIGNILDVYKKCDIKASPDDFFLDADHMMLYHLNEN